MRPWLARSSTNFFIFLDGFKKPFKKDHAEDKDVAVVGKAEVE